MLTGFNYTFCAFFLPLCTQHVITIKQSLWWKWRLTGKENKKQGEQRQIFQFPWNFLNGNACFTPNTEHKTQKLASLFFFHLLEWIYYSIPCFPPLTLSPQLNYISVLNNVKCTAWIGHRREWKKQMCFVCMAICLLHLWW